MTRLIQMALSAGWMILPICFLRWLLWRCPRRYLVLLWVPVALRLCLPLQIPSALSLMPAELSQQSFEMPHWLLFLWMVGTSCILLNGGLRLLRLRKKLREAIHLRDNLLCNCF